MKKVCISMPNVCTRTKLDGGKFINYFKINGWEIVTKLSEADVVLIGLCGVNAESEKTSMKYLSIAKSKIKEGSRLIVTGCLAGINANLIFNNVDSIILTPDNIDELDSILNANVNIKEVRDCNDLEDYTKYIENSFNTLYRVHSRFNAKMAPLKCLSKFKRYRLGQENPFRAPKSRSFYIRVARGCLGNCTYCGLKKFNGPLTSKPINEILTEFSIGLSKGYEIIGLIGEDVGAFGQDIGTNIVELLQNLFKEKGNFRITIDDFSPKWLLPYFHELLGEFDKNRDRIHRIGFQMQSGSERILDLMNREYTAKEANECMLSLKRNVPELNLDTHILVGFPGETEIDFCSTKTFLKAVQFNRVTIYKYSDRPNVISSRLPDKVSERTVMDRIRRLICFLDGRACLGS